jgi:tight adherence protein B
VRAALIALAIALAAAAPVFEPQREAAGRVVAAAAARAREHRRPRRRRRALEAQLPALAGALAAQVRAGRSVAQALTALAADAAPPVDEGLRRAAELVRLGTRPEDALRALEAGPDVALLAAAVRLHARAGGDLALLLETLAETLYERAAQRRAAEAATAQARYTARMVSAMPLLGLLTLRWADPDALALLLRSPIGWAALAASALLTLAGQRLIARIAAAAA